MTAINLSCLHELYNTAEVDSAWAFNGKVKCSTTEDPNKALTVLNPLGSNLREMLSAPPPSSSLENTLAKMENNEANHRAAGSATPRLEGRAWLGEPT